jgi:hypothetical protein
LKEAETTEVIENAEAVAGSVFENLSDEEKAKLLAMVDQQPVVEEKQGKVKQAWNWVKSNKWKIGGAIAGAALIGFLGKKAYDAGMPAEFDADVIDGDYEIAELEEYENTPEVVEETEEVVE